MPFFTAMAQQSIQRRKRSRRSFRSSSSIALFLCWAVTLFQGSVHAFSNNNNYCIPSSQCIGRTCLHAASRERSCIELIDPATGCEVILVGCFHGSPSSAADVEREVQASLTDVIVLELCESRFATLKSNHGKNEQEQQQQEVIGVQEQQRRKQPWFVRLLQLVGDTIQKRGLSTGLATGILAGVSGLQTALSGFTPGLEFTTALELAEDNQECDIVLADQSVDETLEKLGKLPAVVRSMINEVVTSSSTTKSIQETEWGKMAEALRNALVGDPSLRDQYQVNVGQVVTRNSAVIQEMARLIIPPVIVTQLALIIIDQLLFPLESAMAAEETIAPMTQIATFALSPSFLLDFDPVAWLAEASLHVATFAVVLSMAYCFFAVPVTHVILAERDDQLTSGIQSACRMAASKNLNDLNSRPGRVVAVLGLLHINGVAKRMLESAEGTNIESVIGTTEQRISP